MNGKSYITAFLGITLVILSMRQDWSSEIDAVVFGTKGNTTAADAHNMLKALGLELGFVVVATMLSDISDAWGSSMLALMLSLLVLRGLFEIDLFAAFVQHTALRPTPTTVGQNGAGTPSDVPIAGGTVAGAFPPGFFDPNSPAFGGARNPDGSPVAPG